MQLTKIEELAQKQMLTVITKKRIDEN